MLRLIRKKMRGEKGFTLIELLVVIIIIAILAAIAIPTFLGQRHKAQDASAKSLVRNAMTAMESTYVDTQDFTAADAAALLLIEPSYAWTDAGDEATAANPDAGTADGKTPYFFSSDANTYVMGAHSASGKTFAVLVNKTSANVTMAGIDVPPGALYLIDGAAHAW